MHRESRSYGRTELLSIDEADRLKITSLEQALDYSDRHNMGVILMVVPGIEERLTRSLQLYSRIGFAHEYGQLTPEDFTVVLWLGSGVCMILVSENGYRVKVNEGSLNTSRRFSSSPSV